MIQLSNHERCNLGHYYFKIYFPELTYYKTRSRGPQKLSFFTSLTSIKGGFFLSTSRQEYRKKHPNRSTNNGVKAKIAKRPVS